MKLPQLPPEPMRPQDEQNKTDPEIWQPTWRCFCCQDTGRVDPNLVFLVIPNYSYSRDRIPLCQAPGCAVGANFLHLEGCIDMRLTATICQELDRISREDWQKTTQHKVKEIQNAIADTTKDMSIRQRDRTPAEEMEAQRRHEEACNADPQKRIAAAKAYLGDEFMRNGAS